MARKVPHPQSEIAFGQLAVADHVLDGQVLHHDHVMGADQAGAGPVEEIGAGGADLAVRPGDLGPGLGPVRGPALAAGQTPLVAGQVPFPAGQAAGVGDLLAAGGDGEVLDAQVHTHGAAGDGKLLRVGCVDGEGDVPASAGVAETLTVDGPIDAGSIPGEDQANASGVSTLARDSAPSRYPNPDRVNSADGRPVRDLYLG